MKKSVLPLFLALVLCLGLLPTAVLAAKESEIPQSGTAYASTQAVNVDGKKITFYAYALRDENGNDTNYVKLRDIAAVLNGTAAQFGVGWSEEEGIFLETGKGYTANGSEMIQNFQGDQPYTRGNSPLKINGVSVKLSAITLTDADDGEYNYFKLRDLGTALGFFVDYDDETGIYIETGGAAVTPSGDPITLTTQSYSLPSGTTVNAQVITVNMNDPRVSVRSSMVDGKLNTTQNFADICAASGAAAVVNANFFEAYQDIKDPIGHFMVDGEFLYGSSGISSLGITADNETRYGSPALFYRVKTTDDGKAQQWSGFEFNVLSQFADQSVVYTPARGSSFPVTYPGAVLIVENGVTTGYQAVAKGETIAIPSNGFVLYSSTEVISTTWYQSPEMGRQVTIVPYIFRESDDDFSLDGVETIVSGGRLVRGGAIVTTLESAFASDARFTTNSSPRTAVGTTADGKLLLVSASSATIPQMRELMLALGCVEAINLDGGASTAMYYNGNVLVTPSRQLTTTLQVFVSK